MPTNAEPILLDTSAALALINPRDLRCPGIRQRIVGHGIGLSGHAEFETYSVLTRLPSEARLSPHVGPQDHS